MPAARFRDLSGREHPLAGGGRGTVVYLFLSTQCPVSNGYTPRLLALAAAHPEARFVAVYPNAHESAAEVEGHAAGRGYRFPVTRDASLAARLGAALTPQAVVLDARGKLRYRGRIDDHRDAARVRSRDLESALAALAGGRPVPRPETTAFGCAILTGAPTRTAAAVTYTRDVAPILQQHCVRCHRAGEVGPFALESYSQAAVWARPIREYTSSRRMPPWKADSHGEFLDERRLTEREIATLAAWAAAGAPQGDPRHLRAPKGHPATRAPRFPTGWRLGEPDVVVEMPESFDVPAEGRDLYQCFVVPASEAENRWVSAVEVQPGNRAVVHHVIAYLDMSGRARQLDTAEPGPGYRNPTPGNVPGFLPIGLLAAWAPGNEPRHLPAGIGSLLPRGADIVIEVHYHMNGKPERDRTRLGIHWSRAPVKRRIQPFVVSTRQVRIPAGEAAHEVTASATLTEDLTVHMVAPHMHLIGRSMRVAAVLPDGTRRQLVHVPDWDFNWQLSYRFREPVPLPRGTRIELAARYDNSSANPNNPSDPPKDVGWGESTTDEMCVAFLGITRDREDLLAPRQSRGAP